jgi:hypothetical protein
MRTAGVKRRLDVIYDDESSGETSDLDDYSDDNLDDDEPDGNVSSCYFATLLIASTLLCILNIAAIVNNYPAVRS